MVQVETRRSGRCSVPDCQFPPAAEPPFPELCLGHAALEEETRAEQAEVDFWDDRWTRREAH